MFTWVGVKCTNVLAIRARLYRKIPSQEYRGSHFKDKTVPRLASGIWWEINPRHHNNVTWVTRCLKSESTRLFVQASDKETHELRITSRLWGKSTTGRCHTQRSSNVESFSMTSSWIAHNTIQKMVVIEILFFVQGIWDLGLVHYGMCEVVNSDKTDDYLILSFTKFPQLVELLCKINHIEIWPNDNCETHLRLSRDNFRDIALRILRPRLKRFHVWMAFSSFHPDT